METSHKRNRRTRMQTEIDVQRSSIGGEYHEVLGPVIKYVEKEERQVSPTSNTSITEAKNENNGKEEGNGDLNRHHQGSHNFAQVQFKNYTVSSINNGHIQQQQQQQQQPQSKNSDIDDSPTEVPNSPGNYPTPNHTPTPHQLVVNISSEVGRRASIHHLLPSDAARDPNGIPFLSRDFVVRRISEGETGRLKEELKCEACGKGYKHITSLAKHLWEHTPEWQKTKKFLISKHQQVQLLEAASILCGLCERPELTVIPQINQHLKVPRKLKTDSKASKKPRSKSISGTIPPPVVATVVKKDHHFSLDKNLGNNGLLTNRKFSGSWKPPIGLAKSGSLTASRRSSLIRDLIKEEGENEHSKVIYDSDDE